MKYEVNFERLTLLHFSLIFFLKNISGSSVFKHQLPYLAKNDIKLNKREKKNKGKRKINYCKVKNGSEDSKTRYEQ